MFFIYERTGGIDGPRVRKFVARTSTHPLAEKHVEELIAANPGVTYEIVNANLGASITPGVFEPTHTFTADELRVMRDALAVYQMGTVGRDRTIAANLIVALGGE